jgi:hypothetical protein
VDATNLQFLAGSAMLTPLEGVFPVNSVNSRSLDAWKSQNASFVARVNDHSDWNIYKANDTFFQMENPEFGAGFMYDAVMAIGLGACLAAQNHSAFNGQGYFQGVRSVNFTGASGRVLFDEHGIRDRSFVTYAIVNLFHLFATEDGFARFNSYYQP